MLVIYACLMQPPDGKEKVLASNIIILETILECFKKVTSVFMLLDLCQVEPTPSFMFYILHRLWDGTPLTPLLWQVNQIMKSIGAARRRK